MIEKEKFLMQTTVEFVEKNEQYKVKFHEVLYGDTYYNGGTCYKIDNTEIFKFIFSYEVGRLWVPDGENAVACMDWEYEDYETFIISNMHYTLSYESNYTFSEELESMFYQTFTFYPQD